MKLRQAAHARRRLRDVAFLILDFLGDSDFHAGYRYDFMRDSTALGSSLSPMQGIIYQYIASVCGGPRSASA
jgi:hypothetical protein